MLLHRAAELRRKHDSVAPTFERTPDVFLAHSLAVDVRGVEERDAGLERDVDHRERLFVVAAPAEVVRAEPDDRDLRPAVSECPNAHGERRYPSGSGRRSASTTTRGVVGRVSAT